MEIGKRKKRKIKKKGKGVRFGLERGKEKWMGIFKWDGDKSTHG